MTPYQSNRRGSLILDRVFRGVGRLRRATGTKSVKLFEKFDKMLTTLYEGGRRDILISIRDGRLTILEHLSDPRSDAIVRFGRRSQRSNSGRWWRSSTRTRRQWPRR